MTKLTSVWNVWKMDAPWEHSVNDHNISGVCTCRLGWHKQTSESQHLKETSRACQYLVVVFVPIAFDVEGADLSIF